jgi:hypothetical protein
MTPFTSSASSILKETKMDICTHRDTFAFCLLISWRKSYRFYGFDNEMSTIGKTVGGRIQTTSGAD